MAINFPTGPVVGQLFLGGSLFYEWDGVAWNIVGGTGPSTVTAQQQNLIVNGNMSVSQQNQNIPAGTNAYFAADQWLDSFVTSVGVLSFGRVASRTPRKSEHRLRLTITTIDASLAAGEILTMSQPLEGLRLANLGWDGTTGTQLVCRFGFRGPAGTYSFAYRNAANNRSWVSNFTVSAGQANTDIEIIKVIPADTTGGVWPSTAVAGAYLNIALATGTTFVTPTPDSWQTGNFLGSTGISNGLGALNTFELFDVGLYPDPLGTGIPPEWISQTYDEALATCQRYFQTIQAYFAGNVTSAAPYYSSAQFVVGIRGITPTLVGQNAAAGAFPAAVGTLSVMGGASGVVETRTANATQAGVFSSVIDVNARM